MTHHLSDVYMKENLSQCFEKSPQFITSQFHHIKHLVHTDYIAKAFTLQVQKKEENSSASLQLPKEPELVVLLHNYANIFAQPMGLPPQRDHDHSIQLV